ncbi:MAG: transcription termination/antitermination protein NusG [Oscillospiraceae bacterium]|nr:transcription termination/antitermination protein NusG [Oscillospiraceae bacterium]
MDFAVLMARQGTNESAKWYVVHTYSGYENTAAATLEKTVATRGMGDLILETRIPMETVTEIVNSEKKTVERKKYQGYLFVKMILTDESWHVVRNTRGVTSFVGPASKPIPLTEAEIRSLGIETHEIVLEYKEGDNVRITDGPLDGYFGLVDEISMSRNKVRVLVSMFGRETPVEVEFDQVELATT